MHSLIPMKLTVIMLSMDFSLLTEMYNDHGAGCNNGHFYPILSPKSFILSTILLVYVILKYGDSSPTEVHNEGGFQTKYPWSNALPSILNMNILNMLPEYGNKFIFCINMFKSIFNHWHICWCRYYNLRIQSYPIF